MLTGTLLVADWRVKQNPPGAEAREENKTQAGQHCFPPSTRKTCPVMNEAASETRQAAARATSDVGPTDKDLRGSVLIEMTRDPVAGADFLQCWLAL